MKNNIVTKSNTLIESKHYLTLAEERIMLYILSKIQPEDEDFKTYTIRVSDFCDFMDIDMSYCYRELRKFSKKLFSRTIELEKENSIEFNENEDFEYINWVFRINYKHGEGCLELELNPALKPHLLNLTGNFTTYKLLNVINLNSIYSIRLYELLKQYEKLGIRIISVKDLREQLGIGSDKYMRWNNFKVKALDTAMKELEEKTDIHFTYEGIKEGRKIAKIKFHICTNTKVIEQNKKKYVTTLSSRKIEAKRKKAIKEEAQNINSVEQPKTTNTEQLTTNDTNVQKNIQSPNLDKLKAIKEMLKDLNLSKENLLAILKVANGDLALINTKYEYAKISKKENIVGFMIWALKNVDVELEAIRTEAEKKAKEVNYERRNWDFSNLERMEQERLMKMENAN